MSEFLFAYGTLQPGYAPPEIAPIVAELQLISEASANGTLYDLGGYPGAILDPASPLTIKGVVYQLPDYPNILRNLDAYEECDPNSPGTSQFFRELHQIAVATGGTLPCWVYIWNGNPASARIIPDGRFSKNS